MLGNLAFVSILANNLHLVDFQHFEAKLWRKFGKKEDFPAKMQTNVHKTIKFKYCCYYFVK